MSIKEIDPGTVSQWISEGKAILVDVRELAERAGERIAETHHQPLSAFNPQGLPDHDDKIVIYHCAGGKRTAMFGSQLRDATQAASEVYHLAGGIIGWKLAGFATETA
ncbi:MAG: rhodanese-like domain-containing protein [Rhodospirillaceae bacterium]|nr:rhodanese-like domain-containing protein [Rhodospirillaceae bacterium]